MTHNHFTSSGVEIRSVYEEPAAMDGIGHPGEFPFTRGVYPTMYRGRPWTIRQYAGFGTADETNARFISLLEAGQTGLSVAFDLPTQMGLDSDADLSAGEVGKVGVAIDSLEDMRRLFRGIPLGDVTTSMTINATAPILLLMYEIVAEEQGVAPNRIRGTIQNDILKEYVARGTYIYPPAPSMRLVTDVFSYAADNLPNFNTISISGYHIREAGSTAAQELAFTVANGIAYVRAAQTAGLDVNDFAPRLSFFWNAHNHLFEEIAKYRAARRMWARLMRDLIGAVNPRAQMMRFHTQTAGSTLTAQQPLNNVVRTTVQALAATMGGTQSLHTNSFDEALGLPTEESAMIALRTQQILANESGLTDTVDPWAGSFFMEALTDEIEAKAMEWFDRIEQIGGSVTAIEQGFIQKGIEDAAYAEARRQEGGESVVVGLNRFSSSGSQGVPVMTVDPNLEFEQVERTQEWRSKRDDQEWRGRLGEVRQAAGSSQNLLPAMKSALLAGATVGEISDVLREVYGTFHPA